MPCGWRRRDDGASGGKREHMQRKTHPDRRHAIEADRRAPPHPVAQRRGDRPEQAARQPRDQHQRADQPLRARARDLVEQDVGRRAPASPRRQRPAQPSPHNTAPALRRRDQQEPRRGQKRADRHDRPRAVFDEGAGQERRGQPVNQHRRRAGERRGQADIQIMREAVAQHGGQADRSPRDQLGNGQHDQQRNRFDVGAQDVQTGKMR